MSATMSQRLSANDEVILNILNFLCIAPNLFVKIPQMRNIVKTGSVRGLSLKGFLMETIVYMVGLLYYFTNNFPFLVYAEYIALEIQALLMVLVFLHYSNDLDVRILPVAALFFLVTAIIGSGSLPTSIIAFFFSMNLPLNASSKLLALNTIYSTKNSGSASFLMWSISGLTSAVLTNFTVAATLSFSVCCAIIIYRPSEKKFE
ncbi:mannose-P-dolichol utilization defect 1 protein homolog 1-like isoform X2 [Lytechinus variegatus]|uniref:mannose-P-dolichol utilization defect 1 protein homolog 1-like isoform X2 n=1 Tax=Lytechinus variegatus TaxID=7654 RepID=UPI001BB15D48|nr:mannose-P-dolichol utilization defect 1 protein homolog 1-like isoform X2 [Lytechinus variegatus]